MGKQRTEERGSPIALRPQGSVLSNQWSRRLCAAPSASNAAQCITSSKQAMADDRCALGWSWLVTGTAAGVPHSKYSGSSGRAQRGQGKDYPVLVASCEPWVLCSSQLSCLWSDRISLRFSAMAVAAMTNLQDSTLFQNFICLTLYWICYNNHDALWMQWGHATKTHVRCVMHLGARLTRLGTFSRDSHSASRNCSTPQ